jgi:hypothetical protein
LGGPPAHAHTRGAARPRDLDDGHPEPAAGPLHQDSLTRLQPGPADQGQPGGVVVDDERGGLGEGQPVRKVDHGGRIGRRLLGEGAAEHERRHPVAGGEARPGRRLAHDAGHLEPRHEWERGPQLILAAGDEHIGEADAGGVDLDPGRALAVATIGARSTIGRRHLVEDDALGPAELPQHQCSHGQHSGRAGGA